MAITKIMISNELLYLLLWYNNMQAMLIPIGYRDCLFALRWRHHERDGESNHQPHDCLPSIYSGADQRKHQSSSSLAFVTEIHRWPVNSPHKGPVTRKVFPFDDVIMACYRFCCLWVSSIWWRSAAGGPHTIRTYINTSQTCLHVTHGYQSLKPLVETVFSCASLNNC